MNFKRFGRTANLFDYQTMEGAIKGYYLDSNGDLQESALAAVTDYIPCSGGKFCLAKVGGVSTSICLYDSNKQFLYGQAYNTSSGSDKQTIIVNSSVNASYVRFTYFHGGGTSVVDDLSAIMLNSGSTALPYQPYKDWTNTPHYIHNTSTDTLTTLPVDIYANDNNATVGLKGNMEQASGVSPTTPIQPSGCGERTGNLFDISTVEKGRIDNGEVGYVSQTSSLTIDGGTVSFTTTATYRGVCSGFFEIPEGTETITFNFICNEVLGVKFVFYDNTKTWLNQDYTPVLQNIPPATANIPSGAKYVRLSFTGQITGGYSYTMSNLMLNPGSTALPYEPYGYEIPILNNSQTTNVYLGEVETTRKTGLKILKGDENITYNAVGGHSRFNISGMYATGNYQIGYCSHYNYQYANQNYNVYHSSNNSDTNIYIFDDNYTSAYDFKAYLAQQYTNGTPVTIWYVLATPQTAAVNEPIRKIGDYADEVSGISIPVTSGANTLSIGTTLQPSEVTATYKGWHPVQSVHERESGAWD